MKQRLLVMNGQRIVQNENGPGWVNIKVDKAGELSPGIYPLHLAVPADKANPSTGVILHSDQNSVYQQVGRTIHRHDSDAFDKVPQAGTARTISYQNGRATSELAPAKQTRSIKR